MSQYLRRPENGEQRARFQEEEDVYAVVDVRREKVELSLRERLPLPSNPKPPSNPASPTPIPTHSREPSPRQHQQSSQSRNKLPPQQQQSSSQPRTSDPRLSLSNDSENAGRSLTNPPAGRARPRPQPIQQTRSQYHPANNHPTHNGPLWQEGKDGIRYGHRGFPSGPQPRYHKPVDYDGGIDSKSLMVLPIIGSHPSMMHRPRSILIGLDDTEPVNQPNLNVTPLAPVPQSQQRKSTNSAPPSSRRAIASYYPQPPVQVSPIPEESLNIRHGSYAASHVIPTTRVNVDYPAPLLRRISWQDDEEDTDRLTPTDDDQKGLVMQASLEKSKSKTTDTRPMSTQDSTKQAFLNTNSSSPAPHGSHLPTRDRSPPNAGVPAPSTPNSTKVSSPLMAVSFPAPGTFGGGNRREAEYSSSHLGVDSASQSRASSMYLPTVELVTNTKSMAARMKGRKAPPPPGLDMHAVRNAEARGSLTSLPDLIRRATKLAAVLDPGKPRLPGSLQSSETTSFETGSSSSNRRTDSISDILASFPPPVPGANGRLATKDGSLVSSWPLPVDYTGSNVEDPSVRTPHNKGRKICGLPLWAFIILVILALLVITAAVIVPLQLVTLSRSQKNNSSSNKSDSEMLRQCKIMNPCANGGENVASADFCGCVCTGGFGGKNCDKLDSSCVTMDLEETKKFGVTFAGIQNATMGSAIKRLLEISIPRYDIQLDGSRILSTFWASEVSCTAQNALVTFNGKTVPDNFIANQKTTSSNLSTTTPAPTAKRINKGLHDPSIDDAFVYSNSMLGTSTQDASPTPIPTSAAVTETLSATTLPGNRIPVLDEDAVDFSRVVVLFLVQDKGLAVAVTAQENLQSKFTARVDYGTVDAGNQVQVDLDNKVVTVPGEISVGLTQTQTLP